MGKFRSEVIKNVNCKLIKLFSNPWKHKWW